MALSAYYIKRIAAEIVEQQKKEITSQVKKAIDAVVNEMTDEWITTKEACEMLRITERQLYTLKAKGKIPYSKPNGRVLFRRSQLAAYNDNKRIRS